MNVSPDAGESFGHALRNTGGVKKLASDGLTINRTIFVHQKIRRREAAQAILRLAFGADDAPPVIAYVLRVHAARFANASDRLLKRFGDRRSFTDWTTLALLDEERIDRVATFDRWFAGRAEVVDGT